MKSIHLARVNTNQCETGMFCTAQLKGLKKKNPIEEMSFWKGIILLASDQKYEVTWAFKA